MNKLVKILSILLALTMAGSLVAQDNDDAPAPVRSRTGWSPLQKPLAIGFIASYNLNVEQEVAGGGSSGQEPNHDYFGLSSRFFPLLGGKLGAGLDMILLTIGDDANLWQIDFDVLFRFQLGNKLTLNAGLGYSQYLVSFEDGSDPWTSDLGFNVKIGVEYFLSQSLSLSGEFKRTQWEYEDGLGRTVKDTFFSFQIGLHYWL